MTIQKLEPTVRPYSLHSCLASVTLPVPFTRLSKLCKNVASKPLHAEPNLHILTFLNPIFNLQVHMLSTGGIGPGKLRQTFIGRAGHIERLITNHDAYPHREHTHTRYCVMGDLHYLWAHFPPLDRVVSSQEPACKRARHWSVQRILNRAGEVVVHHGGNHRTMLFKILPVYSWSFGRKELDRPGPD